MGKTADWLCEKLENSVSSSHSIRVTDGHVIYEVTDVRRETVMCFGGNAGIGAETLIVIEPTGDSVVHAK